MICTISEALYSYLIKLEGANVCGDLGVLNKIS